MGLCGPPVIADQPAVHVACYSTERGGSGGHMTLGTCPNCEGPVATEAATCPQCGTLVAAKAVAKKVVNTTQLAAGFALVASGVVLYFTMANFLITASGVLAAIVGLVVVAFQLAKAP